MTSVDEYKSRIEMASGTIYFYDLDQFEIAELTQFCELYGYEYSSPQLDVFSVEGRRI